MRILVTGATSLLGRVTAQALQRRGDEVTVFQRGSSGLDVVEIRGDIGLPNDVARAVEGQEAVIHVAAKVGATGPWAEYERVNIEGTKTVVRAAESAGIKRFVYVSSPSVAHAGAALVGAAAAPADPSSTRGHYATSKAHAERFALGASSEAMPIVAIRPHLIWGPGDTPLVGRIIDRARACRLALVGSGTALIDSTYIDNAADALVAAIDRAPELGGTALVVSNGQPRTVQELVGRIVMAAGLEPPTRHVPIKVAFGGGALLERFWDRTDRSDDPPMTSFLAEQLSTAHWFDQRTTQAALQWKPEVSLDDGFRRLTDWFSGIDKA